MHGTLPRATAPKGAGGSSRSETARGIVRPFLSRRSPRDTATTSTLSTTRRSVSPQPVPTTRVNWSGIEAGRHQGEHEMPTHDAHGRPRSAAAGRSWTPRPTTWRHVSYGTSLTPPRTLRLGRHRCANGNSPDHFGDHYASASAVRGVGSRAHKAIRRSGDRARRGHGGARQGHSAGPAGEGPLRRDRPGS